MNGNDSYFDNIRYKSAGEKRIAEFLTNQKILFNYEQGVLIKDKRYDRLWYPDFKMLKYDVFIEYFGMENNPRYDEQSRYKLDVYQQNAIDVIPVYPYHIRSDYGNYILRQTQRYLSGRMSDLEQKLSVYSSQRFSRPIVRSRGYGSFSRSSKY